MDHITTRCSPAVAVAALGSPHAWLRRALLALLQLAAVVAASAEVDLRRLSDPTGPSHNSIFAFTQGRLNRCDGAGFTVYRNDPRGQRSLSANRVNASVLWDLRKLVMGDNFPTS